jgi:hypothetical protein
MMGAARKSAYITAENKLATAYHEAGHALLAIYTKGAYPLQYVSFHQPSAPPRFLFLISPHSSCRSTSFSPFFAVFSSSFFLFS